MRYFHVFWVAKKTNTFWYNTPNLNGKKSFAKSSIEESRKINLTVSNYKLYKMHTCEREDKSQQMSPIKPTNVKKSSFQSFNHVLKLIYWFDFFFLSLKMHNKYGTQRNIFWKNTRNDCRMQINIMFWTILLSLKYILINFDF